MAELLALICGETWGFNLVAVSHTGKQGYEEIVRTKPDVVLLDLGLPDISGVDLAAKINAAVPTARIIVVSGSWSGYMVHRLNEIKFQGFVDKGSDELTLMRRAIEIVHLGGTCFSPRFLLASRNLRHSKTAFFKRLSPREQEVLLWAAQTYSDEEIAVQLGISYYTAQTHRREIMRKLNIRSTPKLILYGMQLGICNGLILPSIAEC